MVFARSLVTIVVLLLAGFVVPGATAQQAAEPRDTMVEDEAGDVVLTSAGGNQNPPAGIYDRGDIVAFWIGAETEDTINVGVKLATLDPPAAGQEWFGRSAVYVYFNLGDVQYRTTTLTRCENSGFDTAHALQTYDLGRSQWRTQVCLDVEVDESESSFSYTLPKAILVDDSHVTFGYGDELTNIYASSEATVVFGADRLWIVGGIVPFDGVHARDRAPDQGVGPNFKAVMGTQGKGDIHLFASDPMRVSNGEATTIVFQVELYNDAPVEDVVVLSSSRVDPTFNVRVPARIAVGPGERIQFPVIVSMEFTHRHGVASTFEIKAESSASPDSWSIVELGVFWTEIPQPAGHHSEMWLHSANREPDNGVEGAFFTAYKFLETWMNPLQPGLDPDPEATDGDVPAYFNRAFFPGEGLGQEHVATWDFPLSPGLLIGLDFDMDLSGNEEASHFRTVVTKTFQANQAELRVMLRYCDPLSSGQQPGCSGQWKTIASGVSDPTSLAAQGTKEFSVALNIDRSADLLPYVPGANLNLHLELHSDIPQNFNLPEPHPELRLAESVIRLPLIEYHDPIDQQFERIGSLKLTPLGDFEKAVNPGRVTYFQFKVENVGKDAQMVDLEVQGFNAEWAHFLEGTELKLESGAKRNLTLMVQVPEGTAEGERAELFVVVQSRTDPTVVAVSRLRASVIDVFTTDIPDEESPIPLEVEADSPGVGPLALLAALGAAAVIGRRRRE